MECGNHLTIIITKLYDNTQISEIKTYIILDIVTNKVISD